MSRPAFLVDLLIVGRTFHVAGTHSKLQQGTITFTICKLACDEWAIQAARTGGWTWIGKYCRRNTDETFSLFIEGL